ncbi:MAG TPA: hydroxymethylbilane synthase [Clostridia bacterium]|nr:hydroxymethylbilane synthase [Clostridia bacterium]
MRDIVIGTRDSALALWQTDCVLKALKEAHPHLTFTVKKIKTKGDKLLDVALAKIGDKGLFTKELEVAMLQGEIDLAVHSMKDLPTQLPQGLRIGAVLQRAEPGDVVLSPFGYTLATLPAGAKVGTSSLRRRAQLLHHRPDLRIETLRGNVGTRIAKMERENFDAIILASAGVQRLGYDHLITEHIPYDVCLPAVGQGAIGVEMREDDEEIFALLQKIACPATTAAVRAERAFLRTLEGGCQIPIGALARLEEDRLVLHGLVASLDGTSIVKGVETGSPQEPEQLGRVLARRLLEEGAQEILNQVRQEFETGA